MGPGGGRNPGLSGGLKGQTCAMFAETFQRAKLNFRRRLVTRPGTGWRKPSREMFYFLKMYTNPDVYVD